MTVRAVRWAEAKGPGLGLAALAGVVASMGQAPASFAPATFIGLAAGFWLILAAQSARRAASLGWAVGFGYFTLTFFWIVNPFLVDVARHGWMAPFALVLMGGGFALFWGAAAWAGHRLGGRMRWLSTAAAFGLVEVLRGWVFSGFPWGGPGLAWIDTGFQHFAQVMGVYGLSALTFLMAAGLVAAGRDWGRLMLWAAVAVILSGAAYRQSARDLPVPQQLTTLRLVQPNAPQHLKWDPDHILRFFDRALALTNAAPEEDAPDLVIWPETSVPTLLGRNPSYEAQVAMSAAPAPIIAGIQRREGATYRNSLILLEGGPEPSWVYDKHHLVPFGEYVPLGNFAARFGIHGLAQQEGAGYAPGPGPQVYDLPRDMGKVLPLICYEAIFPRDIRNASQRPEWLLQATNDAWFGTFSGPQQHLVQARFRAIEFGLPMVRAANTGISAVINAHGEVTASLPLGEAGFIDAALPAPRAPTIYARFGDLPLLLILAGLLGVAVLMARAKHVDPDRAGG